MLRSTCVLLLGLVASARAIMENFIVGGAYANIDHQAHSAFLDVYCVVPRSEDDPTAWVCGASVVNQRILLTAAHCFYSCGHESHIRVHLGSEYKEKGLINTAFGFLIHAEYSPTTSNNDICLVRLKNSLTLNKKISRVALVKKPPYSEEASVAGWGLIDEERGKQTNRLKYVSQQVWSRQDCVDIFGTLPKGTFCAASQDFDQDYASQGDSGSALLVRGYIQIGLVSYKVPSISRKIVIYTDVGYFYDWIYRNAHRFLCKY